MRYQVTTPSTNGYQFICSYLVYNCIICFELQFIIPVGYIDLICRHFNQCSKKKSDCFINRYSLYSVSCYDRGNVINDVVIKHENGFNSFTIIATNLWQEQYFIFLREILSRPQQRFHIHSIQLYTACAERGVSHTRIRSM